ncbi:hypothetical protein LXA43DRAFT_1022027 [Ganoderma leucocontextum]|nr:hypothetical protein LXA43DRAFT_1022027 [Ganoderma leucocontextum]
MQPPPQLGFPMQAFMQPFQPQVVFNPFMAPQYPAIGPMPPQPPPLPQVPPPAEQPWFQALVAAVSKEVRKDVDKQKAPPADLSPEDEKKLVDAIKKGREDKLPMERIFEQLSQKHGYTEVVWKSWFATNVDKVYPKTLPQASFDRASGGGGTGASGSSNRSAPSTHSVSSNRQNSTFTSVQQQPQASSRSQKVFIATPKPPTSGTQAKPNPGSAVRAAPSALNKDSSTDSTKTPSTNKPPPSQSSFSAPTPYSANRSKRGGSVPIVHDQTLIPWSNGTTKPPLPQPEGSAKLLLPRRTVSAPTQTGATDAGSKLTHDEKVFFVHWLRWRLRDGPLPEKETLFEELEAELPHRAAEMWKRHWASHCEVPDGLYIEARKRTRRLTPLAATGEPREGSESESESSDDQGSTYHAAARKPSQRSATTKIVTKTVRMGRAPGRLPVTDEDLRAMARYKSGKNGDWETLPHKPRWREFADRPENGRRSLDAWYSISRDPKHAAVIDRYVKEHQIAAAPPRTEAAGLPTTTPQQTRPAVAPPSGTAKELSDSGKTALKRAADLADASGDGARKDLPPLKRTKTGWDVDPEDVMDLTVDSETET